MAPSRHIRPGAAGGGLDDVEAPEGYVLPPGRTPEDVLARTAELLESEGLDPAWPGLDGPTGEPASKGRS